MFGLEWVPIRNAIESAFKPEIQEAANFATALQSDAKADGGKDLAASFIAGYTAFATATGTFETKALAAITAFAVTLLGYAVTIVKEAETTVSSATTPPST